MRASANAKTNGKRRLPLAPPSVLPPLYARWMGELLDRPLPRGREATCDTARCSLRRGDFEKLALVSSSRS